MKKTCLLFSFSVSAVTAFAGSAPAPAPSGKGPIPAPLSDPCATGISYNSVELLYTHTDAAYAGDLSGGQLRVEYSPWSNIYLTASAGLTESFADDVWTASVGGGAYYPLLPNLHIALDAGYYYSEEEYAIGATVARSREEDGWYARPHLRGRWGCFEAHAGALYIDRDTDENWTWFAQLYYQIAPHWDLSVGYSDPDDYRSETWSAGVRYRF